MSLASAEIGAQVLRGVLIAWNGRDVDESGDEIRENLIEQIRGSLGDEMLKPIKRFLRDGPLHEPDEDEDEVAANGT